MSKNLSKSSSDKAFLPSPSYTVSLNVFEGPLDLLLFLIQKDEIDIYDIPIESITHQYLSTLDQMETLDLEIAGAFLVMATTLMHIKSRMLLPQKEVTKDNEEEGNDPRWELVQQLLEYKKFKEAAQTLQSLAEKAQDFIPRSYPQDTSKTHKPRPLKPCEKTDLWQCYNQILRRLAEKMTLGEIQAETVSIADRMEDLLRILKENKKVYFSSLFKNKMPSTIFFVATFLALLELVRLKNIAIEQDTHFADILCKAI